MSEAKRCLPECGQPYMLCHKTSHGCYGDAHSCWCSPECRDNRRRMHEGEARDPSDDVKLCCPEAKPVTNAAGQPRYWTCAIHPGVAYAPEPLRHAADFRGEGVTRTWGTLCGAPIQTSLVAGTGAVNCPACRLKAAPAPAVEGESPAEDHSQHEGCAWPDEPCNQRRRPAGEPPHKPTCERVTHPNSLHPCSCVTREPLKAAQPAGEPPEMTLGEACAAPAGTVQFCTAGAFWEDFDKDVKGWSAATLAMTKFRRKPAPVLSRVQEMARKNAAPGFEELHEAVLTDGILAVCEWLRACYRQHGEESRACPDTFAAQIAREFLGKGR